MPPRKSLAEMDLAAIDGEDKSIPPTQPAEPRLMTIPQRRPVSGATTARLGISMTPTVFDDVRAAYCWATIHDADAAGSLASWIENALRVHTQKSPSARKRAAGALNVAAEKKIVRTFPLDMSSIVAMDTAIADDQIQAGRYMSRSSWAAEALQVAIEQTRRQAGGRLPVPPARLTRRAPKNMTN